MVRKIQGLFSSTGDQQEQPFVQVNADPRNVVPFGAGVDSLLML